MGKFKRDRLVTEETLERDDYTCQACSSVINITVHHIVRLCDNGKDDPTNTITLCRSCHDVIEHLYNKGIENPRTFYRWLERQWGDNAASE